jgi:RNA polymerase sigma-70 factor (ECF subfamily)
VVLDTLKPAERIAFVLHDIFSVPFDEIAPILDRNSAATRQLASRARARVGEHDTSGDVDRLRHAALVDAFLAAARDGDFDALLTTLDPEIVVRADAEVVKLGAAPEARGEQATRFLRYARGATPALLDGSAAAVWVVDGRPRVVYRFTVGESAITGVELIADPERLAALDLVIRG